MLLTASLLSLFNCARGNATISHGAWLVIAACIIILSGEGLYYSALWLYIVIIVTIRATKPLLNGINGNKSAIKDGFIRNLPIIPALVLLNNYYGLVLLLQGLLYYVCGKIFKEDQTRKAEFFCGLVLGILIQNRGIE